MTRSGAASIDLAADPAPKRYPLAEGKTWATAGFAMLVVLVILGPILSEFGGALAGDGNPLRQVTYILAFLILVAAALRTGTATAAFTISTPVNLLLLWCWASLAWAIAPGVAARRLILTCVIIFSVFIAVECLGRERARGIVITVFLLTFALNLAFVLALPGIGIHQFEFDGDPSLIGDWRGIFPEKNLTGAVTAVTALMLFFARQPKRGMIRALLLVALLAFLVKTGSKTSMGIGLVALSAGLAYRRYDPRNWPWAMILLALLALGAALLVVANLDRILAVLDDRDSFTGRTQIWSSLLAYVGDHWMFGAGYGSFWNIGPASPIHDYARPGSWLTTITSGHNGYLDLTTQIGIPGLALTIFALFLHPLGRLLTERRAADDGPMLLAILVFCAGQNLTESTMLDRDHVIQFCLIWTIASILRRPTPPSEPAGISRGAVQQRHGRLGS